jgi:hypothetical protein
MKCTYMCDDHEFVSDSFPCPVCKEMDDAMMPDVKHVRVLTDAKILTENLGKKDLTIREFQTNLPWTIRYSEDFRKSPMTHKDFAHACHHVSKAAGRLHELADDCDHDRAIADQKRLKERYAKYIADLVICALRMANTFPGGVVDLQQAVHNRLENKNGVKL